MRGALSMTTRKNGLLSPLPSPRHHLLSSAAAAPVLPFLTRLSSSSSSSANKSKTISGRITLEEEERRKRRDNERRRSHQFADIMGLSWNPELEPEFMGPLWESVASANKKKYSGALAAVADKPSSTTAKEETSTTKMNDSSRTSSSSSGGGSDWSDTSSKSTNSGGGGGGGSSSVSDAWAAAAPISRLPHKQIKNKTRQTNLVRGVNLCKHALGGSQSPATYLFIKLNEKKKPRFQFNRYGIVYPSPAIYKKVLINNKKRGGLRWGAVLARTDKMCVSLGVVLRTSPPPFFCWEMNMNTLLHISK